MRRGFDLISGQKIGRYEILSCDMGHEERKKYQIYEYPCEVTLKASDVKKAEKSWARHIGTRSRIIHSEYGSPYECWFEPPMLKKIADDTVVVKTKGIANRRRDIPTLREVAKQQSPPEPADEINALKKDHNVVKSHWATSKCAICGDKILPGQTIAKKPVKGQGSSRGWSHVHCAAAGNKKRKPERKPQVKKERKVGRLQKSEESRKATKTRETAAETGKKRKAASSRVESVKKKAQTTTRAKRKAESEADRLKSQGKVKRLKKV